MAPIPENPRDWLPELKSALRAIVTMLADQQPTPERLFSIAPDFIDAVPGHRVQLDWLKRGYLNEPDLDEPGESEYVLSIYGDRLNAGWLIPARNLQSVLDLARLD